MSPPGSAQGLAQRLRSLRESRWPELRITQLQLAKALGVSPPLISSWEHTVRPATPGTDRLRAYAAFFCTRRSVEGGFRILDRAELTDSEYNERLALEEELLNLRVDDAATRSQVRSTALGGPWHFPDGEPVTIVCGELPQRLRDAQPLANPANFDYSAMYALGDPDALLELYGHIRAANPFSLVTHRPASGVAADGLSGHVVVLGGIDWNLAAREMLRLVDIPVVQTSSDDEPDRGSFDVLDEEPGRSFRPRLISVGDTLRLVEDVGHFVRAPNPLDRQRTLTICNGIFSGGVYGAACALTDIRFRDRNAEYLNKSLTVKETVSILCRVQIALGRVMTPDWTAAGTVLHQWTRSTQ